MTIHFLKIAPEYYKAVEKGIKSFELRKHDRDFDINDSICLQEWTGTDYTGCTIWGEIIYMLNGPLPGLAEGYVILGIKYDDLRRY